MVFGAMCSGKPDPNAKSNNLPIIKTPPTFVNKTSNGILYVAAPGTDEQTFILHLYGGPKDWGRAHGELLGYQVKSIVDGAWNNIINQIKNGEPKWIHGEFKQWVAQYGLDFVLDLTYDAVFPWTPSSWWDELKAIAQASNIPYKRIRDLHLLGELTRGGCSMVGAYGSATKDNGLITFRGLDWDMGMGFQRHPVLFVYHKGPGNDIVSTFASLGWAGWIGALTGVNEDALTIHEIGVTFPDSTFGEESRFGYPFIFLLRDILMYEKHLSGATHRIQHARRTANLILGVGDGKIPYFDGYQVDTTVCNVINSTHFLPKADWHPPIKDTTYFGMDWDCPNFDKVLAKQIQDNHGSITGEIMLRDIIAHTQTGDLNGAICDLNSMEMWFANARAKGESGPEKAYARSYVHIDLKTLFGIKNE